VSAQSPTGFTLTNSTRFRNGWQSTGPELNLSLANSSPIIKSSPISQRSSPGQPVVRVQFEVRVRVRTRLGVMATARVRLSLGTS